MYLNKAMVYGNLTRDPEMKALPSGMQVTSFSIATNRRYKDRDGNYQDAVDYHNIVVFGRQAETSAQYLKKGSGAFVEGRLQTRSWDKDGQKQYRTEIVADRVQFGPRTGGGSGEGAPTNAAPKKDDAPAQQNAPEYPEEDINPEDIPF
ncbi:MAG: single-stranded DNA-binding protein [Candidatus Pacebacteria bacterium]|nr:single-stranded DNA-binding protein [Candidatus Paceibacterota bacterium]